jgi:hypothetical protein
MNAYIFLSNLLFLYIGFFGFLRYNGIEVKKLKVNTSKSKNAESFYIKQSYIDSNGKSTSRTIRKLGTLKELLVEHGPTRDDVMAWAKEQARIETEKFEQEKANHCIPITFHPNRKIAHGEKRKFQGGYLFLQSLYYELGLNKVCRKIRDKHHYDYDLNAILSDLIYTRILEPGSKRSSFETAKNFLEAPTYQLHDIYRALNVLSEECDLIQSELYRNSKSVLKRNDGVLYYDCTNYYFEIEQEDGDKKYGKSKEHRPNPDFTFGFTNNFTYKNWYLDTLITGSVGNDIYNASRFELELMNDFKNQSTVVLNRWTTPGQITNVPKARAADVDKISDRFVEDGSYIKLKSITLGYNFQNPFKGVSKLNVYVTGQNLYTITDYTGFDPEVNAFAGTNGVLGIDYGTYPQVKTFVVGLKANF